MKATLAAAAVAVAAVAVAVYVVLIRGPSGHQLTSLEYDKRECGTADAATGGKPAYCVQYAYDLMGRAEVAPDDDAARSILKTTCDHAYQEACDALASFADHRAFVAEGRCDGAWYRAVPHACVDAGRAYEDGAGRAQSLVDARRWYDKGCKLGDKAACDRFAALAGK